MPNVLLRIYPNGDVLFSGNNHITRGQPNHRNCFSANFAGIVLPDELAILPVGLADMVSH